MKRAQLYLSYILSFFLTACFTGYLYLTFRELDPFLGIILDSVVIAFRKTLHSLWGFFILVLTTWKYSISKSDIVKFGVPYGIFSALLISVPMAVFDFGPHTPKGKILLVIHIISVFVVVKLFYRKRQVVNRPGNSEDPFV
jgi:hypothetical protein